MSGEIPRLCPKCKKRVIEVPCPECEKRRQKAVNKRRNKSSKAFYDSATWEIIRAKQLEAFPFCQATREDGLPCRKIAKHVDHIQAREDGGSDEPENLQSLCVSCHSRKTVYENGGFGRAKELIE